MTGATIARTGPDHRAAFRAATFGDVLRSEWTKLRSVRSTFWALTVTVVLGIGLGAVISAVAAHGYAKISVADKLSWDPTGVSQSGLAIAQLAIAVLGVLYISSEYSSGMIRTSLIAVPKRGRVLAAKSLVFAAVTFVVGEVTSFVAFFVGQALISGHAPHAALGDPGVARAVVGGGLYLTALAVLSVAAGALLRHPAAAIACMMAVAVRPPRDRPGAAGLVAEPGHRVLADPGRKPAHQRLPLRPHPPALARLRRDVPVRRHRVRHRLDAAGPPGRMMAVRALPLLAVSGPVRAVADSRRAGRTPR